MAVKPRNKNLGKHPLDPEYDDDFDYEKELDAWEDYCEEREEMKRLNL